jgi:hypothetical protein
MKIRPTVAGMSTITAPNTKLQRKLAKEGVIGVQPFAFNTLQ